jgi:PPOX class probable FMN-dependent enzyme
MDAGSDHRITTVAALRERMGSAGAVTPLKLLTELDDAAIDFIRRAPFLVLATADAAGNQQASPKGDEPGFVLVENRRTLLIPDRSGNNLLFGLENILANPHVGLLFIMPPNTETLRVSGKAELSADPALLERLAARGKPAKVVIRLTVTQCFFHCAKAFIRSRLWQHESWPARTPFSFGRYLAPKMGKGAAVAREIDAHVEEDYRTNL